MPGAALDMRLRPPPAVGVLEAGRIGDGVKAMVNPRREAPALNVIVGGRPVRLGR